MDLSCKLLWAIQNVMKQKLSYNLMKTIICLAFICVLVVQASQIERNLQVSDIGRRDGRDHSPSELEIRNPTDIENHTEIENHSEIRNHPEANEPHTNINNFPNPNQLKNIQQLPRRGHRQEVDSEQDTLVEETQPEPQHNEAHTSRSDSSQAEYQSPRSGSRKSHRGERGGNNDRESMSNNHLNEIQTHPDRSETHAERSETHPDRSETHAERSETHPERNEAHPALPMVVVCLLDVDCTTAFPNAGHEIICDSASGTCVFA